MTEPKENEILSQMALRAVRGGVTILKPLYQLEKASDFTILLSNGNNGWMRSGGCLGKNFSEVLPDSGVGIIEKCLTVAETGTASIFEAQFDNEGKKSWINFSVVSEDGLLVVATKDITEQKQAEITFRQALETSEKQKRQYDSITNNTPDLVYAFDLEYRFTYANNALLAMWGKSAEEAIGKGLRENGYEEWHAQMHEREIDKIVETKERIRGTVSFPHAELGVRVYDYILTPVLGADGEVEAVTGTTRDITDLKRIEESLQKNENLLRNMIEQAPVALALIRGNDFIFESVNPLMLDLIGTNDSGNVLGEKAIGRLPEWHTISLESILREVMQTGQSYRANDVAIEFTAGGVTKTGYFDLRYTHVAEENQGSSILHMALDVTDQVLARRKIEESEAKLKSVIDQTPAPTLVLRGDNLVIEQINAPMLGMIGRGQEIIGMPLIAVLPELEGQYVWEQVLKVYMEGVDFDQKEVWVPHNRAGVTEDYYYNLAYRPIWEQGHITGMIQVAIEVTDHVVARKKLEESESRYRILNETLERQVIERTRELQRSNEDLQQFAHVASHDLREPVRKIKMFTSRLEDHLKSELDETATRFIGKINSATDRMLVMIEGVLVYSTMSAIVQKPHPTDLNVVIKNIETDLEVALEMAGGKIRYTGLPTVEGAPVLLYQLFYNLVSNSIKFARVATPIHIDVTAETYHVDNKGYARIMVQDNGIGFEANHETKIFDTFTRLNSKDMYEGTGLGLSLCKKIVERHGGSIIAAGNPGKGAMFTITLPMSQTETEI